jgi:hypothetical protein
MHTLTHIGENETDILFCCARCGAEIGFNKPGLGAPSAIPVGEGWTHPESPDQWMGPCEVGE